MIKTFNEYVSDVYEAYHFSDGCMKYEVDDAPTKTEEQIFDEFKKEGFRFIGKFKWENKSINAWVDENIELFIKNYLNSLEKEILGKEQTRFTHVNIYFKPSNYFNVYGHKTHGWRRGEEFEEYDKGTQELIDKYGEQMGVNIAKKRQRVLKDFITTTGEQVINIKGGGTCMYNTEQKYYYFMYLMKRQSFGRYGDSSSNYDEMFKLWIELKTKNLEEIKSKLEEIKIQQEEEERLKQEQERQRAEKERIRKEQDERKKKALEIISGFENKIKDDIETNEDNYKEISFKDIPDDIKKQLDEKDVEKKSENEYFEYIKTDEWDPYDREYVTCFVNNRDLNDGYQYKAVINHAKPGTYWGD